MSDSISTKVCIRCGREFQRQPGQSAASWARKQLCGCTAGAKSRAKARPETKTKTEAGTGETKKRWSSRYGGGEIASGQWLAEVMCERRARAERRNLPLRFWDEEPDRSYFRQQLSHAGRLLRRFSVEVILAALNDPALKECYSLGAAWIVPHLVRYADSVTVATVADGATVTAVGDLPERPRLTYYPPPTRSSLLGRLRRFHGEKEGS